MLLQEVSILQKMGVMTVLFYPCFVFLVVLIISFCALKALGSFSHYIAWREFQAAQGWLGGPSVLRFWFNGLWLLTLLIGFCVSWIWTGKLSFGILSILLVPLVFRYFVRYQEHRWRRSIETSSLSFFNALLGLIQSGRGLSSALFDLAQSQSTPFGKKLKKHLHNYEEGRGLILILSQFRNKMGLPTLENYLSTIEMAYSQGLEIAPLLEKMIPTLEMEQHYKIKTEELRHQMAIQAVLAFVMPWFLGGVLFLFNRELFQSVTNKGGTQMIGAMALMIEGVGIWVLWQITKFS